MKVQIIQVTAEKRGLTADGKEYVRHSLRVKTEDGKIIAVNTFDTTLMPGDEIEAEIIPPENPRFLPNLRKIPEIKYDQEFSPAQPQSVQPVKEKNEMNIYDINTRIEIIKMATEMVKSIIEVSGLSGEGKIRVIEGEKECWKTPIELFREYYQQLAQIVQTPAQMGGHDGEKERKLK